MDYPRQPPRPSHHQHSQPTPSLISLDLFHHSPPHPSHQSSRSLLLAPFSPPKLWHPFTSLIAPNSASHHLDAKLQGDFTSHSRYYCPLNRTPSCPLNLIRTPSSLLIYLKGCRFFGRCFRVSDRNIANHLRSF